MKRRCFDGGGWKGVIGLMCFDAFGWERYRLQRHLISSLILSDAIVRQTLKQKAFPTKTATINYR